MRCVARAPQDGQFDACRENAAIHAGFRHDSKAFSADINMPFTEYSPARRMIHPHSEGTSEGQGPEQWHSGVTSGTLHSHCASSSRRPTAPSGTTCAAPDRLARAAPPADATLEANRGRARTAAFPRRSRAVGSLPRRAERKRQQRRARFMFPLSGVAASAARRDRQRPAHQKRCVRLRRSTTGWARRRAQRSTIRAHSSRGRSPTGCQYASIRR